MRNCYPACTWRAISGLLKPWHSSASAQHDLQGLCPGASVEKQNLEMASRDVRHQREPTFRSIRMGWWQTRCAMSLTSWEWSVAENIITCTQGKACPPSREGSLQGCTCSLIHCQQQKHICRADGSHLLF